MSHALLYSFDLGPARELDLVGKELARRGWMVSKLPAQQPVADPEAHSDPARDLIITGLSAIGKAEGELALGEIATKRSIPWVILADTHESFLRPEAKGRIVSATLIVASPEEIAAAKKFGFSEVLYCGGPPTWQDRWEIGERKRLSGLSTVYVAGVKNSDITNALIRAVADGASLVWGRQWTLIFRPHPSELTGLSEEAKANRGAERAKALAGAPHVLAHEIAENEALLAADACIFTGGSGVIITAAMNRMRQAYFETAEVMDYMIKQIGKPQWWPIEAGVATVVASPADISAFLRLPKDDREMTALHDCQEAAYPRPLPGKRAEDHIAEFLEDLVNARARS